MILLALACTGPASVDGRPDTAPVTDTRGSDDTAVDTDEDSGDTASPDTDPLDADGDGWFDADDCNDADPAVNPGAEEVCGNDRDEDCDGHADECRWTGEHGTSTADQVFYGEQANDGVGQLATFVPDVDGDGADELVLVGRYTYDAGYTGAIAVHFGDRTRAPGEADAILTSTRYAELGGWTDWGDFDADGTGDLVTSLSGGEGGARFGVGYFALARTGEAEIADLLHVLSGDEQPFSVAKAWRIDDTVGDVLAVVGSGQAASPYPSLHLFLPPVAATTLEEHDLALWTDDVWREASEPGSDVGDLDGDGNSTFLVLVTEAWRDADTLTGGVVLFDALPADGSTLGDADHVVWGRGADHYDGGLLSHPGGDFDGDGHGDLVLVDQYGDDRVRRVGCVHVFPGPIGAEVELDDSPIRLCGADAGDRFGTFAAATGDIDGDGRADLLGGETDETSPFHGSVRLFHGPLPAGRSESTVAGATFVGETEFEHARYPTSGGDLDGDGADDFVVGSPTYGAVEVGAGAAFLFYGRGL